MWYVDAKGQKRGTNEERSAASSAVAIEALEQLWREGSIDPSSMVWRAGMKEWLPLGDVPELAYILTRPRAVANEPEPAMPAPDPWKPAVALSSLADSEISGKAAAPAPTATGPAGAHDLPLGFATPPPPGLDPFGGSFDPAAFGPPPGRLTERWKALVARRGVQPMHVWLAIIGSSLITGAAVLVALHFMLPTTGAGANGSPATSGAQAAAASPTPPVAPSSPAATPAAAGAQGTTPAPASAAAPSDAAASAGTPGRAPQADAAPAHSDAASSRRATRPAKATSDEEENDEGEESAPARPAAGPKAAAPAAEAAPTTLTKEDLFAAVKRQSSAVAPCLVEARKRGEIQPGQLTLSLAWAIEVDGSVTNARVLGPQTALATSLPACFAAKMAGWKFPAPSRPVPVNNFPFGPITIH
jgi:hypothetical protein